MTRDEIKKTITDSLVEEFEISPARINDNASLRKDLGIDSLDIVDIVVLIKNEFGIRTDVMDLGKIETLEGLYNYIEQKLS